MVVVGRMDLIIPPCFATEIRGRERVTSCKKRTQHYRKSNNGIADRLGDSSLVIDKLCDEAVEEDTAVVCFYFDFAARNEQSPVNMLGSLLRQLVTGLEGIPEAVVRSFRNQKKVIGGRGLQVSGILKMFQMITTTRRAFICVDALDECAPEHRMVILESLGQIVRESRDTRIFLTGRSHVRSEVERRSGGTAAFLLIEPTGAGIIGYIREKLRSDTTPEIMSSALEENIMESISQIGSETYVETMQGHIYIRLMANILKSRFLLASLHIEAILRETSIAHREKRLKAVKDGVGLGEAYGATLERIKAQGGAKTKLAMAALMWICHTERPLQVDELRHALAVEIGSTIFDSESAPSIGVLLGCCQGLITVDKESSTVRLIHFTVQEYLCAHPNLFSHPHTVIAKACLTYLNSRQVKNLPSYPPPSHQSMPFLEYSSRYWGNHANKGFSVHVGALALKLLSLYEDHPSAVSLLGQVLPGGSPPDASSPHRFSGLHCASFFGIDQLVAALINSKGYEINQGDYAGNTPLSWAARNGHDGAVKLLLERGGVDPERPNNQNITPLSWAAEYGHEGVVKLLLGREDVEPNRPGYEGGTPLFWAANNGYEGIVKLLLGREDVEPNIPHNEGGTPLYWAANNGYEGVVKLLLDRKDVDLNRPENNNRTPLRAAAFEGHEGVVRILLDREDVEPNRPDNGGGTPLLRAAINGHEGVVKLLLGREDIELNRPDDEGGTPLFWGANNGHEGVVKLLLGREDVEPNRPGYEGGTPLFWAANNGHDGVVNLLLDRKDVDPNRPDKNNRTPLLAASIAGHEAVVKLLLGRADVGPNLPGLGD